MLLRICCSNTFSDDFADFKSVKTSNEITSNSVGESFASFPSLQAPPPAVEITTSSSYKPPANVPPFGAFSEASWSGGGHSTESSASSTSAASNTLGWTSSSSNNSAAFTSDSTTGDEFADFTAGSSETEFQDFKEAPMHSLKDNKVTPPSTVATDDKYALLKSLVRDANLFSSKPVIGEETKNSTAKVEEKLSEQTPTEDDTWGEFGVSGSDGLAETVSGSHSTPGHIDWSSGPAVKVDVPVIEPKSEDSEWANFTGSRNDVVNGVETVPTVPGHKPDKRSDISKTITPPAPTKPLSNPGATVDRRKVNSIFRANLDPPSVPAGTGMSPLDIMPPDLPPDMDQTPDEDVHFDRFGTFQSTHPGIDTLGDTGISSLGGLALDDDFGDFTSTVASQEPASGGSSVGGTNSLSVTAAAPTRGLAQSRNQSMDALSTSSMEFTGWGQKTQSKSLHNLDSQSMNSLDFKTTASKGGSKEGTPSGCDSQSVSSLELETAGRKSGSITGPQADSKSVSSLELGVASSGMDGSPDDVVTGGGIGTEDDFGDFNTGPQFPTVGTGLYGHLLHTS